MSAENLRPNQIKALTEGHSGYWLSIKAEEGTTRSIRAYYAGGHYAYVERNESTEPLLSGQPGINGDYICKITGEPRFEVPLSEIPIKYFSKKDGA